MPRFYGNGFSIGPLGLILFGPFLLVIWLFTGFAKLLLRPPRYYR